MIPYIPHTDEDRKVMLATLGLQRVEDLFQDIPERHRKPAIDLPPGRSETEVLRELKRMASQNTSAEEVAFFLGAGAYRHFIPAALESIVSRGEFLTSYTPYQPEASQGTLQAMFEYQSLLADLLGMDTVNASHYDGAAALAEAVLLAYRAKGGERKTVVLSAALHPEYIETVKTYIRPFGLQIRGLEEGAWKPEELERVTDESVCCVVVPFPTFFGSLVVYRTLCMATHQKGALFIVSVDPISLALFEPPGSYGADIVTGEGQSLGSHLSFGGPGLGIFATRGDLLRRMPGRLAGVTCDRKDRNGFVLTLNTREQHIRREKATSNICSNQGHVALRAAVYLSLLGKTGLRRVAELTYRKAFYAAERLGAIPGYRVTSPSPFFREFVLQCPIPAEEMVRRLQDHRIIPGLPLSRYYPDRQQELLVCVTELNTKEEIDRFADALAKVR
ncbi:MAG: aminomethyl-transferring glycine dehydrogenase subunit GcvPA [Spirochaetes bacterium]|nr:aminomethyl-transferring glycine dehydrogenase subunit GcvPA [Spirochaetota bacterium]